MDSKVSKIYWNQTIKEPNKEAREFWLWPTAKWHKISNMYKIWPLNFTIFYHIFIGLSILPYFPFIFLFCKPVKFKSLGTTNQNWFGQRKEMNVREKKMKDLAIERKTNLKHTHQQWLKENTNVKCSSSIFDI